MQKNEYQVHSGFFQILEEPTKTFYSIEHNKDDYYFLEENGSGPLLILTFEPDPIIKVHQIKVISLLEIVVLLVGLFTLLKIITYFPMKILYSRMIRHEAENLKQPENDGWFTYPTLVPQGFDITDSPFDVNKDPNSDERMNDEENMSAAPRHRNARVSPYSNLANAQEMQNSKPSDIAKAKLLKSKSKIKNYDRLMQLLDYKVISQTLNELKLYVVFLMRKNTLNQPDSRPQVEESKDPDGNNRMVRSKDAYRY